jgi:pimeloyl-ACP methyl ester carboxylesterase
MTELTFAQRWAGESRRLPYWEAGAGETIVAILDGQRLPARAHALLAARRRVIVFAMTADAGSPQGAARQVDAAVAALGIERFDLIGEGAGAAAAVWLALAPKADIGSVVLAAPDSVLGGPPDEASARSSGRCSCCAERTTNPMPAISGAHCCPVATSCSSMTQVALSAPSGRRRSPSSRSNSSSGAIYSSSAGRAA